jgi:hypothetical protein
MRFVDELHVTVNCIKVLSVEQQRLYGKFILPTKINARWFSSKVSDVALKQKNVCLLTAFFRCAVLLNRSQGEISRCAVSQFL